MHGECMRCLKPGGTLHRDSSGDTIFLHPRCSRFYGGYEEVDTRPAVKEEDDSDSDLAVQLKKWQGHDPLAQWRAKS